MHDSNDGTTLPDGWDEDVFTFLRKMDHVRPAPYV